MHVYLHYKFPTGFLRRIGELHLLYKPVQEGSKGVREVSFYDALFGVTTHLGDPKTTFPSICKGEGDSSTLRSMLPVYHGLERIVDRAGQMCILYDYNII